MAGEPEPVKGIEVKPDTPKRKRGRPKLASKGNGQQVAAPSPVAPPKSRRGRRPGFSPKKAAAKSPATAMNKAVINNELYVRAKDLKEALAALTGLLQ